MLGTGIGVLARPGIQDQSRKSGKSFEWRSKRLETHRDFLTLHFELLRKSIWAASTGRTAALMTWQKSRQWTVRGLRKFLHHKNAPDQIVVSSGSERSSDDFAQFMVPEPRVWTYKRPVKTNDASCDLLTLARSWARSGERGEADVARFLFFTVQMNCNWKPHHGVLLSDRTVG